MSVNETLKYIQSFFKNTILSKAEEERQRRDEQRRIEIMKKITQIEPLEKS